jgi:hypothetical protein
MMEVVVTSSMHESCLSQLTKSSVYAIRKAENVKFRKDTISTGPIKFSSTMRFIPLAMNHFGLRDNHFNAALREFASHLAMRPSGFSLMPGPFTLFLNGTLRKLLHS